MDLHKRRLVTLRNDGRNMKLILFDCDETLWTSAGHDYISHVPSAFRCIAPGTLKRLADGKEFVLKRGVEEAFAELRVHAVQLMVGVVSDNHPGPVREALQLFGLWGTVKGDAFNVHLWKGYCPKHEMVLEILQKPAFIGMKLEDVYLVDDRDYSSEAKEIGIHFIEVGPDTDVKCAIKGILLEAK